MEKNKPRRENNMKKFIKTIFVVTLLAGLAFSANKRILKSEMKIDRMKRVEPDYRFGAGAQRDACPHQYPNNSNSEITVIDSSASEKFIEDLKLKLKQNSVAYSDL